MIESRDALIAELQAERDTLLSDLQAVRADLMVAQKDLVHVQQRRVEAEGRVAEARDLLAELQANQLAMKSSWKAELDRIALDHLTVRQDLEARLADVLAQSEALRTDLTAAQTALEASQAENLQLVLARNDAISQAAEAKVLATRFETQNAALSQTLSECRLSEEGLSQHIAELQTLPQPVAPTPVVIREPDRVAFVLAPGVAFEDGVAPQWTVEDLATGLKLDEGVGVDLVLPEAAGAYRVVADLDGQLVERSFNVSPLGTEATAHTFSLDLTTLDLSLNPTKATIAATEPLLVALSSPIYALETAVHAGEPTRLYLPAATYALTTTLGLAAWQDEMELLVGETTSHVIEVGTLPVALDLVTGEGEEALPEDLSWVLRDARSPALEATFEGAQADLRLMPGIYDVEVAFDGFVATQTVFIDAGERVDVPLHETVRFNDGAVRLRFSNNGTDVPEGLDLQWRIELQGAAIVTSQTLDGDIVQLPAGSYRLRAQANDVELERDFLVLAGQVTELMPDFTLGQVTLSLLDASGAALDQASVEWTFIPQNLSLIEHEAQDRTGAGFQGAVRTGAATQTLLLPEGRYRVRAQTGAQAVDRLIAVKSADKAAFGLMLPLLSPAQEDGEGLARLSQGL